MPRLVALRPGTVVTAVDLGHFAYRLEFMATLWDKVPCFSLVFAYPPSVPFISRPADGMMIPLGPMSVIALLRMSVEFAKDADELQGVIKATNESETLDIAKTRSTEAFTLFRNGPRIKAETIEQAAKDAGTIVDAAWGVRDWIAAGTPESKRWETPGGVLVGIP